MLSILSPKKVLLALALTSSTFTTPTKADTEESVAAILCISPFYAIFGYAVLYSPMLAPISIPYFVNDRELKYEGQAEYSLAYGLGWFPREDALKAAYSQDVQASAFYQFAGVSYQARPSLQWQRVEFSLAPLRLHAKDGSSEVRTLLHVGQSQSSREPSRTSYGYSLQIHYPFLRSEVGARRYSDSKETDYEIRLNRPVSAHWDVYLHAENKVGLKKWSSSTSQNAKAQYESFRFSLGVEYRL